MAPARVELSPVAERAYERLYRSDRRLYDRVDRALDRLGREPLAGKVLHGELADCRALRVGPIRIVYTHDAGRLLVYVLDIAQRGRAYR